MKRQKGSKYVTFWPPIVLNFKKIVFIHCEIDILPERGIDASFCVEFIDLYFLKYMILLVISNNIAS